MSRVDCYFTFKYKFLVACNVNFVVMIFLRISVRDELFMLWHYGTREAITATTKDLSLSKIVSEFDYE
jgi:hypothetical protein